MASGRGGRAIAVACRRRSAAALGYGRKRQRGVLARRCRRGAASRCGIPESAAQVRGKRGEYRMASGRGRRAVALGFGRWRILRTLAGGRQRYKARLGGNTRGLARIHPGFHRTILELFGHARVCAQSGYGNARGHAGRRRVYRHAGDSQIRPGTAGNERLELSRIKKGPMPLFGEHLCGRYGHRGP